MCQTAWDAHADCQGLVEPSVRQGDVASPNSKLPTIAAAVASGLNMPAQLVECEADADRVEPGPDIAATELVPSFESM